VVDIVTNLLRFALGGILSNWMKDATQFSTKTAEKQAVSRETWSPLRTCCRALEEQCALSMPRIERAKTPYFLVFFDDVRMVFEVTTRVEVVC
jgi:hypothetical protein